jgi:hypothetical protein
MGTGPGRAKVGGVVRLGFFPLRLLCVPCVSAVGSVQIYHRRDAEYAEETQRKKVVTKA